MNLHVHHAIFALAVAQKLNEFIIFLKSVEISSPISDSLRHIFVENFLFILRSISVERGITLQHKSSYALKPWR